jgi:DNA-directed RNA polymerase specialized sigma24 family protein
MQEGIGGPEASATWPADLYDLLRAALVSCRHCRHRVPLDAVDEAYDSVVDRFLVGARIESLGRYAREVLRRRIARGPLRLGARRDGYGSIETCCLTDSLESDPTSRDAETLRQELEGLLGACPRLVPAEISAVRALAAGGSMREVAARLGWSERSVRMRLDRAASKLRHWIESREPRR